MIRTTDYLVNKYFIEVSSLKPYQMTMCTFFLFILMKNQGHQIHLKYCIHFKGRLCNQARSSITEFVFFLSYIPLQTSAHRDIHLRKMDTVSRKTTHIFA